MTRTRIEAARKVGLIAAGALAAGIGTSAGAAEDVPDLTGIWGTYRGPGFGGGGAPEELPLKPEARAQVEEFQAIVGSDTPGGFCLGSGMPGSMLGSGGYPMEIVQHEDVILVIYEAHTEVRHIYLDDRVDEADLFPDRNGYSVGRWEGDTLVVETTHLKRALDQRRFPHSAEARIVEEYSVSTDDDGTRVLTAEMTMTDPEFYTKPVTATKRWAHRPDARLLPYECTEPQWLEHVEQLREQHEASEG